MATQHAVTCPVCNSPLLIEHSDAIGGVVESNLVVLDSAEPITQATPAAQAHAEALGVDLSTVEGTGKPVAVPVVTTEEVPAITKADVAKAAADAEPVNATPVDEAKA